MIKKPIKPVIKFIGANLPESLYIELCKRAETSGRSVSKEVLFIIRATIEGV